MFQILLVLLGICGVVSVVSFILYVRSRAGADVKNENRYKIIHYSSMIIFTVLGVWALVILANSSNYS